MLRHCLSLLIFVALFLVATVPVQAAPFGSDHARVNLVSDHHTVAPGSEIRGALVLDIDPGWHVYWKNAGDSGLPAEIDWSDTNGAIIGDFVWPVPHPQPLETLMNYGYEDRLVLPFSLGVPVSASGAVTLSGMANYLICKDVCIPEAAEVRLSLRVGETSVRDPSSDEIFSWADERTPLPFEGDARIDRTNGESWLLSLKGPALRAAFDGTVSDVRFYPDDHQILHPPEQPVSIGTDGITLTLQKGDQKITEADGLSGVLAISDADGNRIGFSLTAEPGDVLAGTSGALLGRSSGETAALSFPFLLGMVGAALLGGLILNLMPCVLPVLFIKVQSFLALSGRERSRIRTHGLLYMSGVVVCFIGFGVVLAVLRAAGEQAGLGFQLQIPIVVAGLALLMFVLGLNMIGMFEFGGSVMGIGSKLAKGGNARSAFFTGVLAAFVGAPCVGPFVGSATGILLTQSVPAILLVFAALGLGMALPFAVLSLFPGLVRLLPKPGAWMQTLRQFFAFPLFLTAIWLVSVLGDLTTPLMMSLTAAGAVLLALAIWMLNHLPERSSPRVAATGAGLIVFLSGLALPGVPVSLYNGSTLNETAATDVSADALYDGDWSPEAVKALQAEGKAVFVDFTASWCVTCQVNKASTLRSSRVQKAFSDHNVAVLVADWTRRDKKIGEELARHGRAGVPLYLFYPQGYPQGNEDVVILPQLLSPDRVIAVVSAPSDGM